MAHADTLHGHGSFSSRGAVTCCVAPLAFFLVPPCPKDSKFPTPEEKEYLLRRLAVDDHHYEGEEKVRSKRVFIALLDWKLLFVSIMYLCMCVTAYSISVFQPTILQTLGWSSLKSNLLSAPVRIASGIVSVALAHWSKH